MCFLSSVTFASGRLQIITMNYLQGPVGQRSVGARTFGGSHGRRCVGEQGEISVYFLKWRERPVFCTPLATFSGGRHLCTNAHHGHHWMTGAIFVKFSQLILMKIIKIVATRCQILGLKCTKFC